MRKTSLSVLLTLLAGPVALVSQSAYADECEGGACLGANNPVMMDVNADGIPDTPIPIVINSPSQWTIDSPWDCGNSMGNNVINGEGATPFDEFWRYNGYLVQTLKVVQTTGSGAVEIVEFEELNLDLDMYSARGIIQLVDSNKDGGYDTIALQQTSGGNLAIITNIAGIDTDNDGKPDYATFPWANAATFHNPSTGCGPNGGTTMPQISFPLTDTDQDGTKDSVIFDLDGDNQADPEFRRSPKLQTVPNQPPYILPLSAGSATAVPTLAQSGLLLLSLMLAAFGWARVRQNRNDTA